MNLKLIYLDRSKIFIAVFIFIATMLQFGKTFQYFYSLRLKSENLFVVANDGIYIFFPNTTLKKNLSAAYLNISSESDESFDKVSIKQFEENEEILCQLDENLYLFTENSIICSANIGNMITYYSDLIAFEKTITDKTTEYDLVFAYIPNPPSPFILSLYKFTVQNTTCSCVLGISYPPSYAPPNAYSPICLSSIISCQIMFSEELKKHIIVCFCQNYLPSINLVSYSFMLNKTSCSQVSCSANEDENPEKYYDLKSSRSTDKTKALVCAVNEKGKEICYIYDLTENKWSNGVTIFEDCSINTRKINHIFISYISETKEHILYCKADSGWNFIVLDQYFQIAEKENITQNCVNLFTQTGCLSNFSNYFTYFPSLNNYYGIFVCKISSGLDIFSKLELYYNVDGICLKKVNRSKYFNYSFPNNETKQNSTETNN